MIFRVLMILGVIANWMVMGALSSSVEASPGKCETSTGMPGVLFANTFGYVSAPKDFERVDASVEAIKTFPSIASDSGVLTLSIDEGSAELRFFEDGERIYTCEVDAIPFDMSEHSLDTITDGDCAWLLNTDQPILTNIARVFSLPFQFQEVSSADPMVADLQPLTSQSIYILTREPGVSNILLIRKGNGIPEICPTIAFDAQTYFADTEIESSRLCKTETGKAARLRVGNQVFLEFADPFREMSVTNQSIVSGEPITKTRVQLDANSAGITNLILLGTHAELLHDCMIVVE
ncbi:MAG: pilus assembly protein N-terminal domain-containing protein [Pseudomonadota bacterium]